MFEFNCPQCGCRISSKQIFTVRFWLIAAFAVLALLWFIHDIRTPNGTNGEKSSGVEGAPNGVETPNLVANDPFGAFTVTVIRILQGKDLSNRTAIHSASSLEDVFKKGNYLVRFECAVQNNTQETRLIISSHFHLKMQDGLVYSYSWGTPGIRETKLLANEKGRIDVEFEVPINSVPKTLVLNPGLKHRASNTDIAVSVELDNIKIFERKSVAEVSR